MKLAEALLRRKELQEKVDQLRPINDSRHFENRVKRVKVTDSVDEVVASVSQVSFADFTKEFDHYASQLRRIDAAIQQANWTTEITTEGDTISNYSEV